MKLAIKVAAVARGEEKDKRGKKRSSGIVTQNFCNDRFLPFSAAQKKSVYFVQMIYSQTGLQ